MSDAHNDLPDPLIARQAELDQAIAAIPEFARVAKAVQKGFEAEGFSSDQALYLTAVQLVKPPFAPPS